MKRFQLIFIFCLLTVGSLEVLADEPIASDNPTRITMVMHE